MSFFPGLGFGFVGVWLFELFACRRHLSCGFFALFCGFLAFSGIGFLGLVLVLFAGFSFLVCPLLSLSGSSGFWLLCVSFEVLSSSVLSVFPGLWICFCPVFRFSLRGLGGVSFACAWAFVFFCHCSFCPLFLSACRLCVVVLNPLLSSASASHLPAFVYPVCAPSVGPTLALVGSISPDPRCSRR